MVTDIYNMSAMPPGRASLNDVARHAGVSAMTISRVVNGSGPVSDRTRAKVLQALERLGVRKDHYASIASSKRGRRAGPKLVVVDAAHEAKNGTADFAFYSRIAMTILARLSAVGCRAVLTNLADGIAGHLDALVEADAAIYCSPLPAEIHRSITAINRELLCVSICHGQEGASLVAPNDQGGGVLAAEQAAASGHREVVVLTANRHESYATRTRAFVERLRALRPEVRVGIIDYPLLADGVRASDAAVQEAIARHWSRPAGPPGLAFAVGGYATLMLYRFAQQRRIRVPEELSLLGFDAMPFYEYLDTSIDRIEFDVNALGHLAVDEVLRRLNKDTAGGAVASFVPCTYVAGGSLCRPEHPCPSAQT
jgi:LacI family transcriptional regulator